MSLAEVCAGLVWEAAAQQKGTTYGGAGSLLRVAASPWLNGHPLKFLSPRLKSRTPRRHSPCVEPPLGVSGDRDEAKVAVLPDVQALGVPNLPVWHSRPLTKAGGLGTRLVQETLEPGGSAPRHQRLSFPFLFECSSAPTATPACHPPFYWHLAFSQVSVIFGGALPPPAHNITSVFVLLLKGSHTRCLLGKG